VPIVNAVASYEQDYRPDFKTTSSYIRRTVGSKGEEVEYDLDSEDERWLENFNTREDKIDDSKFELMLTRLERACATATEKVLLSGGGSSTDRLSNSVLASTCHLPRDAAFDALRTATGFKHAVLSAVYEYWQEKREKRNKPLLRRLQAATSVSDTNPYNVFRPREKAHRPQTRRRRENDLASFEKMRDLRLNMEMAKELLECVVKREKKKRDILCCKCDVQNLRMKFHHDPKNLHDHADSEALTSAKSRARKFIELDPPRHVKALESSESVKEMLSQLFPVKPVLEAFRNEDKIRKKKRKEDKGKGAHRHLVIPTLPPPPPLPELEMLFTKSFTLQELPFIELPETVDANKFRARFGRGGRIILQPVPHIDSV